MAKSRRLSIFKSIESHLERTAWGRGIYGILPNGQHITVPGARPGQIRAGAKKLYDVIAAQARREQKQTVQA